MVWHSNWQTVDNWIFVDNWVTYDYTVEELLMQSLPGSDIKAAVIQDVKLLLLWVI